MYFWLFFIFFWAYCTENIWSIMKIDFGKWMHKRATQFVFLLILMFICSPRRCSLLELYCIVPNFSASICYAFQPDTNKSYKRNPTNIVVYLKLPLARLLCRRNNSSIHLHVRILFVIGVIVERSFSRCTLVKISRKMNFDDWHSFLVTENCRLLFANLFFLSLYCYLFLCVSLWSTLHSYIKWINQMVCYHLCCLVKRFQSM